MRKLLFLMIIPAVALLNFDLYGQYLYLSTSMTNPRSPEPFKVTYGGGTEFEAGFLAFSNKRLFFSFGFGYISMTADGAKVLQNLDLDEDALDLLGGGVSYQSIQTGVGYVFLQRTRWIEPYFSGSLALGTYDEDPIQTVPASKFEVKSASRLSLRGKVGLGIQSWIVRDKLGLFLAYEYATLSTGESRGTLNFSVLRLQVAYK